MGLGPGASKRGGQVLAMLIVASVRTPVQLEEIRGLVVQKHRGGLDDRGRNRAGAESIGGGTATDVSSSPASHCPETFKTGASVSTSGHSASAYPAPSLEIRLPCNHSVRLRGLLVVATEQVGNGPDEREEVRIVHAGESEEWAPGMPEDGREAEACRARVNEIGSAERGKKRNAKRRRRERRKTRWPRFAAERNRGLKQLGPPPQ